MNERIYRLTFEPFFRVYIWGGRRLESLFGRRLPPGIVAESWDISGHASTPTRVRQGYWQSRTLPEVLDALGLDLVGYNSREMLARGRFPLLIKLLDANRDLSVQVHPDDAYAREHEQGELGKTEMWYVLHAEPGTELIYGLARGVTKASFRAALQEGSLHTQLYRLPIAPGDAIFVPAGTVHALLAGAVVAEIQQNSDTTYRVYDWGRLGADGRPRPLHIDKALEVIDWTRIEPPKQSPMLLSNTGGIRHTQLVACPQFNVECLHMSAKATLAGICAGSTFEIWGCVAGQGLLEWPRGTLPLVAVSFVLLPATLGNYRVYAQEASTWLRVYIAG